MDFDEAYRVIGAYSMAFARRHVLEDEAPELDAILSGESSVSDNVSFQSKDEMQ